MDTLVNKIDQIIELLQEIRKEFTTETTETTESIKTLLDSDQWPVAVKTNLICDVASNQDKIDRGTGIIDLMVQINLNDKKFLDFGCGEGHCVQAALSKFKCTAVGCDPATHEYWSTIPEATFVSSLEDAKKLAPFDCILLYDVLDHASETPESILSAAASLLADNGVIYVRCHPWVSRHGTHIYHKLNKAYAHLVLTDDELKEWYNIEAENNAKVIYPINTYSNIIKNSKLKTLETNTITSEVEGFFKQSLIAERIKKNAKINTLPEFQMGIMFIDFVLAKL